ncbi:MAG: glycosyltransferase family 39 protein [Clostridiales bacterium]|nr:glycosyltransferase family 39 protein [Clostridiales bacterium]
MTQKEIISSREIKSTMIHRSFIFIAAACVFFWLVTRCSIHYMTAQTTGVLMAGLWIFLGFYVASCVNAAKWQVATAAGSGVISFFLFEIIADRLLEAGPVQGMYGVPGNLFWVIFIGGVAMILSVLITLIVLRKITSRDVVLLIMILSFWTRLTVVLYTPITHMYQHDMAFFDDTFYGTHDTYILYTLKHWNLIDKDVRELAQFYQPPLHYFLSAFAIKINSWIFPSQADNYEVIKMIPLFCSTASGLLIYKIIRYFKISGPGVIFTMCLTMFLPEFLILSASVNNDSVSVFFAFLAFWFALLWYREPKMRYILFTAAAIGLSMMGKLSGGLIAVPVAFIFLAKLLYQLNPKARSMEEGYGRENIKVPYLIGQFAAFAAVVFPLGLWFPLRNLIRYGVPIGYVNEFNISAVQDVSGYSAVQRIFLPAEGLSAQVPFVLFNEQDKDYQMFLALLKTSLFDEKMFQQNGFFMTCGSLMLTLFTIIAVASVACLAVFTVVDIRRGTYRYEACAMAVLFVAEISSYVSFCLKYKAVCSQNMRYVVPIVIPLAYTLARGISALNRRRQKDGLAGLLIKMSLYGICALVAVFSLLCLIFYGSYWMYFVQTGAGIYD